MGILFFGYSQLNFFLEVYVKMVDRGDGLIDCFLVIVFCGNIFFYVEVKFFVDKLNNSLVKDFRYIYNQIYVIYYGV